MTTEEKIEKIIGNAKDFEKITVKRDYFTNHIIVEISELRECQNISKKYKMTVSQIFLKDDEINEDRLKEVVTFCRKNNNHALDITTQCCK